MWVQRDRRVFDAGELVVAPVRGDAVVRDAERAAAAGADVVEVRAYEAPQIADLIAAIRARLPHIVVGVHAADRRVAEAASRADASLAVPSAELADYAVAAGVRRDRILVEVSAPNTVAERLPQLRETGWPLLATLPDETPLPEVLATASIWAWQGVQAFRTNRVADVRQALDMVASIRGTREPAVSRRGLA